MSRYLHLWEIDNSKLPEKLEERGLIIAKWLEMVKKDLKNGLLTDWGQFPGGDSGYAIGEGTELDEFENTRKYTPYIKFQIIPILSIKEVANAMMRWISRQ